MQHEIGYSRALSPLFSAALPMPRALAATVANWLRLCPPQNESNQTKRRHRNRKGTNRLTLALRMAAQSVGRTNTPLGLFYRRIRSRIGGLGAVKAEGNKIHFAANYRAQRDKLNQ